jgi:hypothetical protein
MESTYIVTGAIDTVENIVSEGIAAKTAGSEETKTCRLNFVIQ